MQSTCVGVDGCRLGWCFVTVQIRKGRVTGAEIDRVRRFKQVFDRCEDAKAIAVDIPIGLPDLKHPRRACDEQAKSMLRPDRSSSVFFTPPRSVVKACARIPDYGDARSISFGVPPKKLSAQTFYILHKIHEVDRLMDARLQRRVFEIHPEVSFRSLRGQPIRFKKKCKSGLNERIGILSHYFQKHAIDEALCEFPKKDVAADDVLDALVAALTAWKYADGKFGRLPENPPTDSRGLRMEIVYPLSD